MVTCLIVDCCLLSLHCKNLFKKKGGDGGVISVFVDFMMIWVPHPLCKNPAHTHMDVARHFTCIRLSNDNL